MINNFININKTSTKMWQG